ncbi:LacI family DNA-binding transcriptional regulator [Pseudomonas sp. LTJR-52]|uniref:LacI family DNA-binding transcriptional regulator n=1 Tax=Pseudomonas sp. LTJR-52 TaxID=2479392 RepID=UPI0021149FCC|nr:LacI family DNA-binding transcriptional regulator [Pseudomonas sp. LTJR-52]
MSELSNVSSRRPTMEDVARLAGVSLSTVDRVINLRARVRADTARRIADAAAQLGFHARGIIEQRLAGQRPIVRLGFLLMKQGVAFYQGLAEALAEAAAVTLKAQVRVVITYLDDFDPSTTAQRILALRGQVDALGVVAADHREVCEAVASLRAEGMPVIALVSDLAASAGAVYVGLDSRRAGRTAGWFITQLARQPGAVALLIGTQRFQCQELCEMSFRSYLSERAEEWELLVPRLTLEDEMFAYENTLDLLRGQPDLAGLYVAGGGIEGVLRALREVRERQGRLPVVVCHDLTPLTQAALKDGLVQAVLSHPLGVMAQDAVHELVKAVLAAPELLPMRRNALAPHISTPESV